MCMCVDVVVDCICVGLCMGGFCFCLFGFGVLCLCGWDVGVCVFVC